MKLSIVVPAHNEEENIKEVIERIESSVDVPYELLVVDDHSVDATGRIIGELCKRYNNIRLIENHYGAGFVNAVKAGFDNVRTEAVVLVMADLCDDLSTIKKMLGKLNEGYDVACGSRYINGGARIGGSGLKGFFSHFVGRSLYFLLGLPTSDISNAFKMYRKNVLESINIESESFEVSMELPLKAYYSGFKVAEVPTVWKERTKGKSSFKMLKLLPNYLKLYLWALFKSLGR